MKPMIYQLVYASSAVELFSPSELKALLETSRRNNEACGVTGMLLYKDGNFMQVLEGEKETVERVHDKIMQDPRHRGAITLLQKYVETRQFANWSMGFRNLCDEDVKGIPGYSEFMNVSLMDQALLRSPSQSMKLLCMFKAQ